MELHHELAGVSSSQETKALYKALCSAQKKYQPIKRSGVNRIEGFRYPTFRDICDATLPSLLENGFAQPSYMTGYDRGRGQWVMVGTLNHESGEWISSVCPLLMGYPEGSHPGIQNLEIDCTYAKKILHQGLCGGWLESEEGEPTAAAVEQAPEVKPEPAKEEPLPVKKQPAKKPAAKSDANEVIRRAEAALATKGHDEEAVKKIFGHLADFVEQGRVTQSDVLLLAAKHKLDAKVTGLIQREEVAQC